MYEYKYVSIDRDRGFWQPLGGDGHRSVIDEHAAMGWRYVGYIPTEHSTDGVVSVMDLIFERQIGG